MPITVEFAEEGHVFWMKITDPWTMNDMVSVFQQARPHFDKATYKIHTLANVTETKILPPGVLSIRQGNPTLVHPNRGHAAVVGANSLIKTIGDAVTRVARFKSVQFFNTEDQAWISLRQIIAREDQLTQSASRE
jgi:hypothetical protein